MGTRHTVVDDDLVSARWLRSLGDMGRTLVVDPVPGGPLELPTICQAVLTGMGKHRGLFEITRSAEALAFAWLSLGEYDDILVLGAEQASPQVLAHIDEWFAQTGTAPWFVISGHAPPARRAELAAVLEATGSAEMSIEEMGHLFPESRRLEPFDALDDPPPAGPAWEVPRVDSSVFRQACRRLLDPEVFKEVDALCVAQMTALRAELAAIGTRARAEEVGAVVARAIDLAPSTEHLVIAVRVAQAACFLAGWRMHVVTGQLLGAANVQPRRGLAGTGRWWRRLNTYRDPDVGAVAALYVAGIDLAGVPGLAVGDVSAISPMEVIVAVGSRKVTIMGDAARYLIALLAYRRHAGVADDEALFITHRRADIRTAYAADLLRAPLGELGLAITPDRVPHRHAASLTFLRRYGITLERCTKAANGR